MQPKKRAIFKEIRNLLENRARFPSKALNATHADKRKTGEIGIGKFRHIPMATANPKNRRNIERDGSNFKRSLHGTIGYHKNRLEVESVLYNSVWGFSATDILVLVPAAHMSNPPCFEGFERHRRRIMVTRKKITIIMG